MSREESGSSYSSDFRAKIVAQLSDVTRDFTFGDEKYYGIYFNRPLDFDSRYTVFIRALVYSEVSSHSYHVKVKRSLRPVIVVT